MRRFLLPIALNQGASLLFGMLGISLISHIVPKPVYGAYGLFLTLTQLGLLLTHSGLTNHASRYWQREQMQAGAYGRFLLSTALRQAAPLAALLLVITVLKALTEDKIWIGLWPLLVASNLVIAVVTLANTALNASERHWAVLTLNGLSTLARAMSPVVLALLIGPTLVALSLGFTLHAVVIAVAIVLLFSGTPLTRSKDPGLELKWRKELRDFGRPFVVMGIGGWLLLNADRWVVDFAFGKDQLGLFNMASNIACIVPNMVAAALLQWVFPGVFRQADAARSTQDWRRIARRCDQATWLFLGLTLAGLISLSVVGPYLTGWLIANQYAPSMPFLLPAGLAVAASQVNQFQYLLLQGQHDSRSMVKVLLVLAVLRTGGSIIAASISWAAFLGWLTASTVVVALLGRFSIQHLAFRNIAKGAKDRTLDSVAT